MKLTYEEKRTPTFRKWLSDLDGDVRDRYEVDRILCNSEWRTLTFCTSEFRVNFKFSTAKEYASHYNSLKKTVTKHCRVGVMVNAESKSCSIEAVPASDADEEAVKYEADDFGFVRA